MPQKTLTQQLIDTRYELSQLQTQASYRQRELDALSTHIRSLGDTIERRDSQIAVLQSDRDRLTAALEVQCRRHASPTAEYDRSRSGRYAGVNPESYSNQKIAEPKR